MRAEQSRSGQVTGQRPDAAVGVSCLWESSRQLLFLTKRLGTPHTTLRCCACAGAACVPLLHQVHVLLSVALHFGHLIALPYNCLTYLTIRVMDSWVPESYKTAGICNKRSLVGFRSSRRGNSSAQRCGICQCFLLRCSDAHELTFCFWIQRLRTNVMAL